MGCTSSKVSLAGSGTAEEKRSRDIDAQLRQDRQREQSTVKILLLGTGESGKSTILKQMHLIYGDGFQDREAYISVVRSNLIQSAQVILDAMPYLELYLPSPLEQDAALIRDVDLNELDDFKPQLRDALQRLYANRNFKQAIIWGNQYQLNDSVVYLFDHIAEMSAASYIPSDNDILRARVRSTGITENLFKVGNLTYRVLDVGGQRSERRKWAHCFEDVHVLLYLVAISEYDQRLFEDEHVLRVSEALEVYKAMVQSKWFRKTTFILFLNKVDLFQQKLAQHPLQQFYPEYTGGNDIEAAHEFMLNKFMAVTPPEKQVYVSGPVYPPPGRSDPFIMQPHYTTATDTGSLRSVMQIVQEMILREQIKRAGLV